MQGLISQWFVCVCVFEYIYTINFFIPEENEQFVRISGPLIWLDKCHSKSADIFADAFYNLYYCLFVFAT